MAGRRFAELGVRGFATSIDAMAGDFERARDAARRARATACTTSGCTRPRSGWRSSTPRSGCWPATRVRAEAALDDAERVAREIGDRLVPAPRSCVDRAHVLLAQDRPAEAAAARWPRIDEVPAPNDLEWRIKRLAARGKLAAREGRAERGAGARPAPRSRWPTRPSMFLFRADAWRDLAEVAERVGEAEEAAAARATALRLYRAKGNVAAARQLDALRRRGRQAEPVDR